MTMRRSDGDQKMRVSSGPTLVLTGKRTAIRCGKGGLSESTFENGTSDSLRPESSRSKMTQAKMIEADRFEMQLLFHYSFERRRSKKGKTRRNGWSRLNRSVNSKRYVLIIENVMSNNWISRKSLSRSMERAQGDRLKMKRFKDKKESKGEHREDILDLPNVEFVQT